MRKFKFELAFYRPLSVVVKDIAIGVGGSPPLRLFFFEIVFRDCVAWAQQWATPLVTSEL